jgi:hypothetical protein
VTLTEVRREMIERQIEDPESCAILDKWATEIDAFGRERLHALIERIDRAEREIQARAGARDLPYREMYQRLIDEGHVTRQEMTMYCHASHLKQVEQVRKDRQEGKKWTRLNVSNRQLREECERLLP